MCVYSHTWSCTWGSVLMNLPSLRLVLESKSVSKLSTSVYISIRDFCVFVHVDKMLCLVKEESISYPNIKHTVDWEIFVLK